MDKKMLFVASTRAHILSFHIPYLCAFRADGWIICGAWGGPTEDFPYVDEFVSLPFEKKMIAAGNFRAAAILRKKIKQERYDVIIVHTSLAAFFTRVAVLGLKHRPTVINMAHGYLFDDQTSFLKRSILLTAEHLTAPVTDLLLTMNQWDYQAAQKYHLGKTIANVPGIGVNFTRLEGQRTGGRESLRQSLGISSDSFVLIYPAEFSARKSQQILLHAMTALPEYVTLVLPGSGAMLEECKSLAQALGLISRVRFPGYITEMGAWYEMADAAISASRIEGLPFNIMEAMYSGLPVVASAVKGHVDLVRDGETGLLYPYGDWAACAAQVQRLLDSPELARSMADLGKASVLQYDLDEVLPQVMAQYNSVLKIPASL